MSGAVVGSVVLAADQMPEDVGKAGPVGLLLTVLLAIAIVLLVKSMSRHLKRIPPTFDDDDDEARVVIPDTPAELVDPPGQDVLDRLRQAPRAIEAPRPEREDDGPGR